VKKAEKVAKSVDSCLRRNDKHQKPTLISVNLRFKKMIIDD